MLKLDKAAILSALDHTLLKPQAGAADYQAFFQAVRDIPVASVCIPPNRVRAAQAALEGKNKICTVIGFPNGYQTPAVKAFEAKTAVAEGADEIDMVVCIGDILARDKDRLTDEVRQVREAVPEALLKVIIETGALSPDQIRWLCEILPPCGVDFLKTSTGFNFPGASLEAVQIMRQALPETIGIKASGGIQSLEEAMAYLDAGASRIGASRLLAACQSL
ncbi:deoxyribose-phosphate aldolase [Peptococcus simiae]|uniref:Deoxyribose-phosphate aldolase n=1 Tax=Peptococcus simiae TaxID=1643805 RepID=A0ABW9GY85_9FIRM